MLQRIQDEIDARARKFDFLDEAALYLIQKGDSTDAITTQAEIDSFRQYHRQVLDRVAIANARLSAMQVSKCGTRDLHFFRVLLKIPG